MPRPQFTLRALLVATLVVSTLFGWVAHHANVVRQRDAMRRGFDGLGHSAFRTIGATPIGPEAGLPWMQQVFGEFPIGVLFYFPDGDPDGSELRRVRSPFPEAEIYGWPCNEDKLPPGMERWPKDRYWMI